MIVVFGYTCMLFVVLFVLYDSCINKRNWRGGSKASWSMVVSREG